MYFSQRFHTVSLDFLGTGKSDRLSTWNRDWWESGGEQAAALIRHLCYEQAVLVGTSGGAISAVSAAIHHPELIRAVVADSFSLTFTEEMFRNNVLAARTDPGTQQAAFWKAMHGEDLASVIEKDTGMIRTVIENGDRCISGNLEMITCPVLLTYARQDNFLPDVESIAKNIKAQIKNCKLAMFDKGDHPLIWTNPEDFYSEVEQFLTDM